MSENLSSQERALDQPVRLDWVLRALWVRKWLLLSLLLLGGLLGAGLAQVVTKRWEAVALVRIGEIAQVELAPAVLVENPLRAVERLRDPGFKNGLVERVRRDAPDFEAAARGIMTGLRSNPLRGADLVEIRIAGTSPERARRLADLIVDELRRSHAALYEAGIGLLRSRHANVNAELRSANAEREMLEGLRSIELSDVGSRNFAENVHLATLVSENDKARRELTALKLALESALAPGRTFPTGLLSEIYVPDAATSPRLPVYAVVGAIAALFLGFGSLLVGRTYSGLTKAPA